jgi:DNA replication and repair protein RecF
MTIASLRITNFRNLTAIDFIPCLTGLNILYGNNGSGKTSLLEAIHFLGLGRSFRSVEKTQLIKQTADKFSIFSQLVNDLQRQVPIGIERQMNGAVRLRIAEKDTSSLTELASYLPLRIINSQSHQLLESGPSNRRKFLDWGLFYQSDSFLSCWRHFERALKQRNMVLSNKRPKQELNVWTNELVKYGMVLDQLRRDYIADLTPLMLELTEELLGIPHLEIIYQSGWNEGMDFAAVLNDYYLEECRAGHTLIGPHRADLTVFFGTLPVKHFLSRGQQKLLICAMIMAQGKLLFQRTNKKLIYLVDDLPAELDVLSQQKLITLLAQQQTQVFITAIERESIYQVISTKLDIPIKVFHVEHGGIVEMCHERCHQS